MAVVNRSLLGKIAIAALLDVAVAAPGYAYTLNHQPYYQNAGNVVDKSAQSSQSGQVAESQNFSGQVETINQSSYENNGDAVDSAQKALESLADDPVVDPDFMGFNDDPSAWKTPIDDTALDNTNQAQAAQSPNTGAKPSVPSYARQNSVASTDSLRNSSAAAQAAALVSEDAFSAGDEDDSMKTSEVVAPAQQVRSSDASSRATAVEPRGNKPTRAAAVNPRNNQNRTAASYNQSPDSMTQAGANYNGYVIPSPKFNVDYATRDAKVRLQGNAYVAVDASKSQTAEDAAKYDSNVISRLKSRNVDPSTISLESLKEQRLSLYDLDRWKIDQDKRAANPFGDLYELENTYKSIPAGSSAYYVRHDIDKDKFLKIMGSSLDRYMKNYDLGITVLDDRGLVMFYNNNDFPVEGISNLEIAYLAGKAMYRQGDTIDMRLRYNATDLNRSVYSPFANLVLQDVYTKLKEYEERERNKAAAANGKNKEQSSDTESANSDYVPVKVIKMIADIGRTEGFDLPNFGQTEPVETDTKKKRNVDRAALDQQIFVSDSIVKTHDDLLKEWNKSEARNKDRFSEKLNAYTSSPIKTILYYMLNYDDSNAADLLLGYLGSTTALNFELKSNHIMHTRYNVLTSDVKQSPELNYHNVSPLFDMAKLYAAYIKDKEFPDDVRNLIDTALDNSVNTKRGIYRGISNSIRADSPEDRSSLQVFSIDGLSGVGTYSTYGVATELAYINYKGERLIIAIGVKNIPARNMTELKKNGEKYISFTASNIFNLLRDAYPFLKTDSKLIIPIKE